MTKAEIDALIAVVQWLGWALVAVLSFLGLRMYNDVRNMKENWVSKDDLADELAKVQLRQDERHTTNTKNLEHANAALSALVTSTNHMAVMFERRIGEVLTKMASLRPVPPPGQHERRRGYGPPE